jgi:hypothetical protein
MVMGIRKNYVMIRRDTLIMICLVSDGLYKDVHFIYLFICTITVTIRKILKSLSNAICEGNTCNLAFSALFHIIRVC